ncbi:hypothetical protein GJ496_004776 [Pomphorhynchus laevis]|nr:hypothetical protein GJ496_004776 [Pomphorhynchus laevis]
MNTQLSSKNENEDISEHSSISTNGDEEPEYSDEDIGGIKDEHRKMTLANDYDDEKQTMYLKCKWVEEMPYCFDVKEVKIVHDETLSERISNLHMSFEQIPGTIQSIFFLNPQLYEELVKRIHNYINNLKLTYDAVDQAAVNIRHIILMATEAGKRELCIKLAIRLQTLELYRIIQHIERLLENNLLEYDSDEGVIQLNEEQILTQTTKFEEKSFDDIFWSSPIKFKSESRGNESESDEDQLTETEIEMRVRQLLEKDISEFEELDLSEESNDYSSLESSFKSYDTDEYPVVESTSRISNSQNESFDNEMRFSTQSKENENIYSKIVEKNGEHSLTDENTEESSYYKSEDQDGSFSTIASPLEDPKYLNM